MIESGQYHVVPDEGTVFNENAALVLKLAAHIDEDVFSHMDVFAAVGIEGGEQSEGLVHRPPDQLRKEGPQLLRRVVAAVYFSCDAQGFLTDAMHEQMGLAAALHRLSAVQMFQKSV